MVCEQSHIEVPTARFAHFTHKLTFGQGGTGIAKHDHGLVLSELALGAELTTYVIKNISFFG
jgi:hypothetical protein